VKDRISLLTLGCLGCLSVVGIFAAHQLTRLESNLAALIREAANRKETMETLTELVTRPSGRVTTATATRGEDESQAEFVARFDALVELLRTTG
jgi:dihydrodipicolinate synthase/N-acetylneuraminate lyase